MLDSLGALFQSQGFLPHGQCYLWRPTLLAVMVTSDLLIGFSYVAISLTLYSLVRRIRLPFSAMFVAFGLFILACGLGHLWDVWTLWTPAYWTSAAIRIVTALASVATALWLFPVAPRIVAVAEAARAEELSRIELEKARDQMEANVLERTRQLQHANDALRRSEERYRVTFENAAIGVAQLELDGRITLANPRFRQIFGLTDSGGDLGDIFSLMHDDDVPRLKRLHHRARAGSIVNYSVESRVYRSDGTVSWISLAMTLAHDEQGPAHFIGIVDDVTARKVVQRENDRFIALLENSSDFVAMATPDLQVFYMNPAGRQLVGLTSGAQVKLTSLVDYFAKDERTRALDEILPALRTEDRWNGEVHFRNLVQGTEFPVLCNAFAIRDPDGNITELACVSRDVREQKEATLALAESRSRFKRLVDSNIIGVFFYDGEGHIVEANDAFLRTVGMPRSEFTSGSLNVRDLSPPELRDRDDRQWAVLPQAGVLRPVEREFLRRDGSRVAVIVGAANFEGSSTQGVAYILDVSDRKRVELQLRESETKFRKLHDSVPQLIWMSSGDGMSTHYNQRWFDFTGLDVNQSQGWGWLEAVHPNDRERTKSAWIEARDKRQAYRTEYLLRRHDGQYRWHLSSAVPQLDEDGKVQFWFGTLTDIHDQKLAEETLKRGQEYLEAEVSKRTAAWKEANAALTASNHELEAFCYSVSHDLRAPLRGIDGFSLALLEDYGDKLDESGKQYLGYVRDGVQQMGRLIDDLLNLSRLTRTEIRKQEVDLTELAESTVARLRRADPERNVRFKAEPASKAVADPGLVAIVLDNLIANAWKFTSRKPEAEIVFGQGPLRDGQPTYFVRDNGVGFNMAYYNKLFGAFQRLHSVRDYGGTGIGLATVRRIVHRHGGRVWAESEPDKGAVFYFTLDGRVSKDA